MNPREELQEFLGTPIFQIGGGSLTIGTVLLVVAILIATFWMARLVRRGTQRMLRRRMTSDEQAVIVYSSIAASLVATLGVVIALRTTGLELTGLFAAGGIFAVAIGFATQGLINNFVSGIVLRFEGAIKMGDVLEIDGQRVKIQKMMMRAMVARNLDEQDVVIPNSELAQSSVVNYTLRDRKYRLRTQVGVVYSSDMRRVRETLETAAREVSWRSPSRDPVVLLKQFGDSSVDFDVSVWIDDPWTAGDRRSDLNEALWWALADAGITIAFPQVDVHFDRHVIGALGGNRGSGNEDAGTA